MSSYNDLRGVEDFRKRDFALVFPGRNVEGIPKFETFINIPDEK